MKGHSPLLASYRLGQSLNKPFTHKAKIWQQVEGPNESEYVTNGHSRNKPQIVRNSPQGRTPPSPPGTVVHDPNRKWPERSGLWAGGDTQREERLTGTEKQTIDFPEMGKMHKNNIASAVSFAESAWGRGLR